MDFVKADRLLQDIYNEAAGAQNSVRTLAAGITIEDILLTATQKDSILAAIKSRLLQIGKNLADTKVALS